ncbi:MAG: polysaccharide biosynthesis protein [Lachnospiraceae bacterium]|nr:polysaccharide biosynthesis protein [Lachnospiraceae bacterium]
MRIERTKNASRNIIFGVILKAYQILVPFLMRTAMIYLMGVQYLGLNSLFTSVLHVLNLAELGVGSAMVYSMYKPIAEDDDATICALMKLYRTYYRVIGLVIAVVGCALTPFIPHLIKSDVPAGINIYILYLLNLGATVLSYWLFAYKNSILQAHQRTDVASKVTIITNTIQYGLQFFVLWAFHNYYLYVIVMLATQALTNIVTALCADKLYPQFKPRGDIPKEEVKQINQRIKDLFTAKLGTTIVNSADTIVISAFLGLTVLAVYQNYYYIMTSVVGFLMIIMSSCTAGIGNSLVTESMEKNYSDFRKLNLFITWIAGICVCCFLNIYQPFMILWAGEEYLLSFGCVILMCLYFYLYVTNHLMATYKDAAGIWHEDRFRPLCASMFNLALNLLMVRYIGIFAIILSTVLSYILVNMPWLIHNLFKVVFKRNKNDFVRYYLKNIAIITSAAIITCIMCIWLPEKGIMTIILRLIISVSVPNIVFILLMGHGDDYIGMLDIIDRVSKHKFARAINAMKRRA